MPHAKPTFCSLFGPSGPGLQRTQTGVTELIVDIVDAANRTANAKQALNQMFDGNGKATGAVSTADCRSGTPHPATGSRAYACFTP